MATHNNTMSALKLYPDPLELRFESLPIPEVTHPDDAIVKILLAGLCGSDLHAYRGLEPFDIPYVTGHELVGVVAQYIRVPHAGGTLFRIPQDDNVLGSEPVARIRTSDASLILLGDILPTGYFAALQAIQHPNLAYAFARKTFPVIPSFVNAFVTGGESIKVQESDAKLVFAVVGLGPVGLCALISLVELLGLSGVSNFAIVAVDPNEARRAKAENILSALGSTPGGVIRVVSLEDAPGVSKELSGGLGCDAILEFPLNGGALYSKNVSLAFGRCPVRSIFPYCIELLMSRQDIFSVGGAAGLIDKIVPFDESSVKEAYREFNEGKCGKVLFRMSSD
ncbi:hypothetical protein FRC11_011461 [Ceratobasidium sp. 423]|nr:hypothetical protein FRC11_011461 [Ceratobasidium sp. 423]